MKYPIGIQSFKDIRDKGYVYVDKTALIYQLVTTGKIYFLSRPRRFGKSLLVSTLEHYFLGHKELFKGLAMEQLEQDWFEYPVFHIDFNNADFTEAGKLEEVIERYVTSWENIYGKFPYSDLIGSRFAYVLEQAHKQTGRGSVVLIDGAYKPILDVLHTDTKIRKGGQEERLEKHHRSFLNSFYSVFKGADAHLHFVFLTDVGNILPSTPFSGFNNARDLSMHYAYDSLCGITQEELLTLFADPIRQLSETMGWTEEETFKALNEQYGGYHFSHEMTEIFNPFSLIHCFKYKQIADYWSKSNASSDPIRLLNHFSGQLKQTIGQYYFPEEFSGDVEDPLSMIYQGGYLTIKGYDQEMNSYLLDFPNKEVERIFRDGND